MKKISLLAVFLFACTLSTASQTQSNTTPGPVWRVTYYRVLPGKSDEIWTYMRKHTLPVFEEAKKQGVIVDYKIYTNSTPSSPDDWNLIFATGFKNWGALDDSTAKIEAIRLKHHGSQEKLRAAFAQRDQAQVFVATKFVREVSLNPLP